MQESQLGGPLPYRNLPKKLPSKYSTPIVTAQEIGTGYSANVTKQFIPRPKEDPIRSPLDTVKDYKRKGKQKEVKTISTGMPIVPMKPDYDSRFTATGVI